MSRRRVVVIGGGVSGLGTSTLLAHRGFDVVLLEKNASLGGACNRFSSDGFTFDTGPSWYMMPEIFSHYFELLGESIGSHIQLLDIAPTQRYFFPHHLQPLDFYSDLARDIRLLALIDGSDGCRIEEYFARANARYLFIARHSLHGQMDSVRDYVPLLMREDAPDFGLIRTLYSEIQRASPNKDVQGILATAGAFLGNWPWEMPALYSFLSHAQFGQGLKHPKGGMYTLIEAVSSIARSRGVDIRTHADVRSVVFDESGVARVECERDVFETDIVISAVDRSHTEQLLGRHPRKVKPGFSATLLYLGVKSTVPEFAHHTFLFSEDWEQSARETTNGVGSNPLVYISHPGATDSGCAPSGHSALFVLVPVAASTQDDRLEACVDSVKRRLVRHAPSLEGAVVFEKRWYPREFGERYRTLDNSALGPSHTFLQSGPFRAPHRDLEHPNLFYVGATSNPGVGLPACLLSAEQVTNLIDTP